MRVAGLFWWTCIDKGGSAAIHFACMVILARFLSPKDFGEVGVLAVFISLGNLLVDSGMAGALVKKKHVDDIDYGTLFVYNGICSIVLYFIFWLISPAINWFFHNENLDRILKVLSLVLIFNAISIVQHVKLVRHLEMKKICIISIAAGMLAAACAVAMAVIGCNVWSWAFYFVLYAAFRCAGYYIMKPAWPTIHFCKNSFVQQFKFGGYLLGANVLNVTSNHLTSFAIGRGFSMSILGYYYQAHRLYSTGSELLTTVIDRVAFPVLCTYSSEKEMRQGAVDIFRPIFTLLFPAFAIVVTASEKFVVFVLGEPWRISGQYLAVLSLALFPGLVKIMLRSMLKALGKTSAIWWSEFLTVIIMLGLVCGTLFMSIFALVSSMTIGFFISMLIYIRFSYAYDMVPRGVFRSLILLPASAAAIAAVVSWGVLFCSRNWGYDVIFLIAAVIAGLGASLAFYIAVKDPSCQMLLGLVKKKLGARHNA